MTWLAQGGRHGYSPTLGVVQNAVAINLELFDSITVNADGTVTVGPGATFRDLVSAVGNAGREISQSHPNPGSSTDQADCPVAVGSCPCVGATGAMLGGGLGRLQGLHGLTSDAVQRFRLATWNGTIIEASPDIYSADLTLTGENLDSVVDVVNSLYPLDPALALVLAFPFNATTLEVSSISL